MRFLKIARRPGAYSERFYAARPELASLAYDEQFAAYCGDFFGPVDSWSHYMRKAGIDATDIIGGVEPLDRAWWRQHRGAAPFPAAGIFEEQIRQHSPDVLFLEGIESFLPREIESFRRVIGKTSIIAGMTGTDLRTNPALMAVDVVFSCMKGLVAFLAASGRQAVFLPHSFDPRILANFPNPASKTDEVHFVGNFMTGSHMHDFRLQVVKRLVADHGLKIYSSYEKSLPRAAARYGVQVGAYYAGRTAKALLGGAIALPPRLERLASGGKRPQFNYDAEIARQVRPGGYGLAQFEILRRARMTLNVHVGLAQKFAANMRLFEATGIGTCLVTDRQVDLHEFFEPGCDVAAFSTVDEASEVVRYLRDNPREAEAMAIAGQKRTLRDHTFVQRIPILLEGIESGFRAFRRVDA